MNQAQILLEEANNFSDRADIAKVKNKTVDYKALYEKAYLLKKEAALLMSPDDIFPMPRIWVLNAAASLAYKAGKYAEALETIALCRSFNPDEYTSSKLDELEELIQQAVPPAHKNGSLHVTGILTSANGDEKEIGIRDLKTQELYAFMVPAGMFKKVVKTYWLETVSAVAKVSPQGVFTLEKISLAPAA